MDFSIDIHTTPTGDITIEDFSKNYGQYIDEDVTVITSYDSYKYSESSTLNSIVKISTDKIELIDVLLSEHDNCLDSITFKVAKDGFYTIEHIILPNLLWLANASEEYKSYYEHIYVTDNEKVYKLNDAGVLEECTIKEIMERNIEGTTIKKCKVNIFFTGNLQQCYINICKIIFNNYLTKCHNNADTFDRDFIWMTLNIIDYLVGFKQFMEAQRILENFERCGNFCSKFYKHNTIGCGCIETQSN